MSDNTKRTREAHSGINIQIRFVPEERTHSEKEATISVQCDETKKGSPDNLRQITLPQLAHLGGHGEMFMTNRYKLQTAIFNYKGWNGPEWFKKRMSTLTQTFAETAMINMSVMQKKARKEFLDALVTIPKTYEFNKDNMTHKFICYY